jgi:transcriptional regulator with XRE-family HTH domain
MPASDSHHWFLEGIGLKPMLRDNKEMTTRGESRKCYNCGKTMVGQRQNYRYTECGLNSVTLKDIIVFNCECGSIVPEIPRIGNLHEIIAFDILSKDSLLSAEEIRFVRKVAGYSSTELAQVMAVTKGVMSRWENGKATIGKESDRLLRFACFFNIAKSTAPDTDVDDVLEHVKKSRDINLPAILQKIEDRAGEPRQVVINPDTWGQQGAFEGVEAGLVQ